MNILINEVLMRQYSNIVLVIQYSNIVLFMQYSNIVLLMQYPGKLSCSITDDVRTGYRGCGVIIILRCLLFLLIYGATLHTTIYTVSLYTKLLLRADPRNAPLDHFASKQPQVRCFKLQKPGA